MDEAAQKRLGADHVEGLFADAVPDRIYLREFGFCFDHVADLRCGQRIT
jgi:hypothetical protein